MTDNPRSSGHPALFALAGLAIALIGGAAGWFWQSHGNPAGENRAGIERVVHDYILDHPEILPEAMQKLRQREDEKQLSAVADEVEKPFPGAILGNPSGTVTLVEFTDFACTYCRKSVNDVAALVAANPDLRVVVRELPILTPQSADAARMALAAAEQGKYAAFHHAMFAMGHPDRQTIAAAAMEAGLDMARAGRIAADPAARAEISRNLDLARQLGFTGTPSWVIGDRLLTGAVGQEELAKAIAEARG
jgi:protein-disulfide isomerase